MHSRILSAAQGHTIILKDVACALTMSTPEDGTNNHTPQQRGATHDAHNSGAGSSQRQMGARFSVDIVIQNGAILEIGTRVASKHERGASVEIIDASKLTVMPGLVDCHTHPIFAGNRAQETVLKAQGMSYEEIAAKGGGISISTKATRAASTEELQATFKQNALTALSRGVCLMEAKTGYGLNPREELRLLECIYAAANAESVFPAIAPTILAPHAASPDFHGLDAYVQALVDFLPSFVSQIAAYPKNPKVLPPAVDIFMERNYFTAEHGDRWLAAALQHEFDVHIHADEFSRSGGCEVAIALAKRVEQTAQSRRSRARVLSVDHCQYATDTDLSRLAIAGVSAVALPTTSFFSNIPFVDAKKWRETGIRVAIASDFNPGSAPMNNLWFAAYLALTRCGFSPAEVLRGVTVNAAYALGADHLFGTLEVGRPAHLIAFKGTSADDFFASPTGDHLELVITVNQ